MDLIKNFYFWKTDEKIDVNEKWKQFAEASN